MNGWLQDFVANHPSVSYVKRSVSNDQTCYSSWSSKWDPRRFFVQYNLSRTECSHEARSSSKHLFWLVLLVIHNNVIRPILPGVSTLTADHREFYPDSWKDVLELTKVLPRATWSTAEMEHLSGEGGVKNIGKTTLFSTFYLFPVLVMFRAM